MLPAIRRPTLFDVSRLMFVGAIWGGAFIFIELALTDFQPVSIATWRVLLGAMVMFVIVLLSASRFPRGTRHWLHIFIVGCLNSALPFFLISWGQQTVSSAETAVLVAAGTFCSMLVSHFVSDDERINMFRAVGVTLGFIGVLVLVFWDMVESGAGSIKGQAAVALAGCSYAISSIIARRLSHLPLIPTSAATLISASLYMVPLAFLLEDPVPEKAGLTAILSLAFLGVIATALAMTIRFFIIRDNGAVFMSQVGYLVPLFGVIWSGLFFADAINMQTVLALSLILLGIAISRKGHA
ncbi:MAG: DMT family transporter [Gammaproteobacteria bacterium]|nr:DMT family transporter [Gammaproteobacteria bacterium]